MQNLIVVLIVGTLCELSGPYVIAQNVLQTPQPTTQIRQSPLTSQVLTSQVLTSLTSTHTAGFFSPPTNVETVFRASDSGQCLSLERIDETSAAIGLTSCTECPAELSQDKLLDLSDGLLSGLFSETEHHNTGFLDFNLYHDTRDFNILTINAGAKLPCDFEYFQFVNFTSEVGDSSETADWRDFFTEIHLRRPIGRDNEFLKHLDWTVMFADGSGPQDVGRLGIRWRLHDTPGGLGLFVSEAMKLHYTINFHVVESDGSGWQIEHFYRRNFFDGLIYVSGFADHNINGVSENSDWVAETQLGVKLVGNFFAVTEYRYTSFAPSEFRSGWGIGLEYVVPFR